MYPRTEMLDLAVIDGRAWGTVARDLASGEIRSHAADAVVLGTGGYGTLPYPSSNAKGRTRLQSGAHTSVALRSRIRASRRFIQRAFPFPESISRSSR